MKKLISVMILLLLVIPAANSLSASLLWTINCSDHQYYDDTKESVYGMLADAGVDTNAHDVYLYIPSWSGSSYPGGDYQKLDMMPWFGNYDAAKLFKSEDGYPPPGSAYADIDFYYFIDVNDNGSFDLSSDPYLLINYPSGTFSPQPLPVVDNVLVTRMRSNVVVSWDGIPLGGDFGDDGNDQYRVRVIDKATNAFYVDSGKIEINSSNKYVYDLGDLSTYGDNLWVAIEAREAVNGVSPANRSRYYASAPPASSVSIDGAWVITDHRKNESGAGEITQQIQAYIGLIGLNSGDRPALFTNGSAGLIINTNPPTASNTGYLNDALDFGTTANEFDRSYDANDPANLAKFENQSFTFQLYDNSNNFVKNLTTINTSEFEWLDFINLNNTPQGSHPVFQWQDVQGATQYIIRIMRDIEPAILFQMAFNAGQGSYSFQYTGDLLSQYNDAYIRLEARALVSTPLGSTGNRSIVFLSNPVSNSNSHPSGAMPWVPLLLLDD